jgi:hypothetical protein
MRSLVYVVLAGCFVSFVIANELKFEMDKTNHKVYSYSTENTLDEVENDLCEDPFLIVNFDKIFFKVQEEPTVEIETIEVYEIEEDVNLGFDTKSYLPSDFNPYEMVTP